MDQQSSDNEQFQINRTSNGCFFVMRVPEIVIDTPVFPNEDPGIDLNNWQFIVPEGVRAPSDCLFTFGEPFLDDDVEEPDE